MKRWGGVIFFVLLVVAWWTTEKLLHYRVVPPPGVMDVRSFLQWRPSTEPFTILVGDDPHLLATGAWAGLLPSGSSAYVFDRTGRLVDWSPDVGDDDAFDKKWRAQESLGGGNTVNRTDIDHWLSTAAQARRDPSPRAGATTRE